MIGQPLPDLQVCMNEEVFWGHGQMWLLSPLFFSTCLVSGCHQTGHRRGQGKEGPFQSSEGITSKAIGSCKPWGREEVTGELTSAQVYLTI